VSVHGGLVSAVLPLPMPTGTAPLSICQAALGDPGRILVQSTISRHGYGGLDGAGSAADVETAADLAVVEAVERYSASVFDTDDLLVASAAELGATALDLTTLPRCSATELDHPACPIVEPDVDAAIRWVRGVDLCDLRPVWLPATMVYLNLPLAPSEEAFHLPISTGCAAHFDLHRALINGLCEVIERDAIALTWLQRLPLPHLLPEGSESDVSGAPGPRGRTGRRTWLFDATTDLGVPTVYGVNTADAGHRVATVVAAATAPSPAHAVRKVVKEIESCRVALEHHQPRTDDVDEFKTAYDGALYMAAPQRRGAFSFLLESASSRSLADMPDISTSRPTRQLADLLERLRSCSMNAYAVELTTREAEAAGLRVVRVIVPELQPMSFSFRARYLRHPRLYDAPARMGYPIRPESDVNPDPQPMA
jgi:ribosomal protein S12 methylthiotransferase accessory factor